MQSLAMTDPPGDPNGGYPVYRVLRVFVDFYGINVGEYTSLMDPMGKAGQKKRFDLPSRKTNSQSP